MREKGGRSIDLNHFTKFNDMLDYCSLNDLGHSSLIFTLAKVFTNINFVQQRLDRIVGNPDRIIKFPNAKVMHLNRLKSYHCPHIVSLANENFPRNDRPFRCEPMWMDHPHIKNLVHHTWGFALNSHQEAT